MLSRATPSYPTSEGPTPDDWSALGIVQGFPRNAEIFAEGDPADRVYKVRSGAVRVTRLLSDGRRQIVGFCLPGDVFALEPRSEHRFGAEAIVDCQLLAFPRRTLEARARADGTFAQKLFELTADALARAQEHMVLLGRKTAMERIATFLTDMAERCDDGGRIRLPMSRSDVADFLGLTIETVSRTLTQLEREGAIALPNARQNPPASPTSHLRDDRLTASARRHVSAAMALTGASSSPATYCPDRTSTRFSGRPPEFLMRCSVATGRKSESPSVS